MKKTYKLWELEESKKYEEVGSGAKYKVHEGELYKECKREGYSTRPCMLMLSLDEVNMLEFVEVESGFNPYATRSDECHYWIGHRGGVVEERGATLSIDDLDYGNAYSDYDFAKWKVRERKLLNNLERFSYENGGNDIDWGDIDQLKHHISIRQHSGQIELNKVIGQREVGQVYFISREVAEKALEKYRDLIEEVYFQIKHCKY